MLRASAMPRARHPASATTYEARGASRAHYAVAVGRVANRSATRTRVLTPSHRRVSRAGKRRDDARKVAPAGEPLRTQNPLAPE